MKTIYLAGFDVFRPDASAHGQHLKALCRQHGFEGLYPLDNQAPTELNGAALAHWIYQANIGLLNRADCVMANLNPFRGAEPDSGTAFEVGYAIARGLPVWAYTQEARPLIAQIPTRRADTGRIDAQGYTVEDFGLNLNLMIACSTQVVIGDAQACLLRMEAAGLRGMR
ncbi:nucleoside 2-deoxyribosyltransferase [Castellaniella caeni]|uniref:nucleoside 2-deoxyribosyltransferase n=1 Tax=Castellaniella caeni TaxID=266123 RepID=UPI00082964D6|nr:nucleoside 2-deoxyribosyltransferase [Castellaniella caeni]